MMGKLSCAGLLLALLTLSACGSADDESSISGAFNEEFDKTWSVEFVTSCVNEAVKVGALASDALPACTCISDDLLTKLDGMAEKINPPREKMDRAMRACNIPID